MFKQWFYPKEFRIATPPPGDGLKKELARLLDGLADVAGSLQKTESSGTGTEMRPFLLQLANLSWRLRRALVPFDGSPLLTSKPREESRKAFRSVESLWKLLEENQITIVDHTGTRYRSGMQIKAFFEPSEEVEEEKVIDTIKPTIYHADELVQTGEVLVGTPGEGAGS